MAELSKDLRKETNFSEAAVDGLFTGILAGLVIAAFLAVTALVPSETLGTLFSRFSPARAAVIILSPAGAGRGSPHECLRCR